MHFTAEVAALAVASASSIGVELAGVDILLDEQEQACLLESNMPCGFATCPKFGLNVPGMMADYLAAKAERLR